MPKYEVVAWTVIEASDPDDAFVRGLRMLTSGGWQNGQIVDDGVRLLEGDEADVDAENEDPAEED